MQYRTRYKGEITEIPIDLRSTKHDMNMCCFTQASPLTTQRITPEHLCEFSVIYIRSDGTFIQINKQTNKQTNKHTHIHTTLGNENKKLESLRERKPSLERRYLCLAALAAIF